jgi:hypothetical protein
LLIRRQRQMCIRDSFRTWCEALVRCADTSIVSILRPFANEMLNATIAPVKAVIDP